jgi:hypothetical protein
VERLVMLLVRAGEEIFKFKNWRDAHRRLDYCCDSGCTATRLERYAEFNLSHDDFGRVIGKDCVLSYVELIRETRGDGMKEDEALFEHEQNRAKMLDWYKREVELSVSVGLDRASAQRFAYQRTLKVFSDARDFSELNNQMTPESTW